MDHRGPNANETIYGEIVSMSGLFFNSLFGDCKECKKVNYADKIFLKKHLRQKHDYQEILKKADSVGLLDDLTKFYPIHILIEKLTDFASKKK